MGGPPYPAAVRLAFIAQDHWAAIDGEAASRGVDYLDLPVDRFCNAIYWWVIQRVKDPEHFEAELNAPLGTPAYQVVSEAELEADGRAFMAFATSMGVKPPANGARALPSPPSTEASEG